MLKITLAMVALLLFCAVGSGRSQTFEQALDASYAAEAKKDYQAAIKNLRSADSEASDDYLYHLRLGWLYFLAGMNGESVSQYQAAVKMAPGAVEPLQGLLKPLAADARWPDVVRANERILEIDPENYLSLQQVAYRSYVAKDYRKAAQFYGKILKLYPSDVEMMLGLGYSQKLVGDKTAARKTFNRVLLLSPGNPRALEGLK